LLNPGQGRAFRYIFFCRSSTEKYGGAYMGFFPTSDNLFPKNKKRMPLQSLTQTFGTAIKILPKEKTKAMRDGGLMQKKY